MGAIPIILFLTGFLLLSALLSYHTLKNTYQNLQALREALATEWPVYWQQLGALCKLLPENLQEKAASQHLRPFLEKAASTKDFEPLFALEQEAFNTLQAFKQMLYGESSGTLEAIQEAWQVWKESDKKIFALKKRYLHLKRSYQNLLERAPSAQVARLAGFSALSNKAS